MLNNSNNLNNLDPSFVIPVIKQSIAFSLDRFQISSAAQQDTKKVFPSERQKTLGKSVALVPYRQHLY